MFDAPPQPFLTENIPLDSGGLDYLGLRWVNLKLLAERLLPGINNATRDFGTYCLATWIAWKFRQMCHSERDFTKKHFTTFREAVEVAISFGIRPESAASLKLGVPHRRIGVRQKFTPPGELSFKNAKRGNSTSIFSAPLYGPSLKYLGLLADAAAIDQSKAGISIPTRLAAAELLGSVVDTQLSKSGAYAKLARMGPISLTSSELDDLAVAGLHPASARLLSKKVKQGFLSLLVPKGTAIGRTTTARLLVSTVKKYPNMSLKDIRAMWHTGLTVKGTPISDAGEAEAAQRQLWAVLQSRQYQRWIIETFLLCFETALRDGFRTIDDMAAHLHRQSGFGKAKLKELFAEEAVGISSASEWHRVGSQWHKKVGPAHPKYLANCDQLPDDESELSEFAFRLLARWWIPLNDWPQHPDCQSWLRLGGEDRIGTKWFHQWITDRLDQPIRLVLRDILEKLVFAQHVRIALSRFDGEGQRLRFALGDRGIIPVIPIDHLTDGIPGWTNDRLGAMADLLSDLSVVSIDSDGRLALDELAQDVLSAQ
jgi:hypothetical protein